MRLRNRIIRLQEKSVTNPNQVKKKVLEDEWNDLLDDIYTDAWLDLFDDPLALEMTRTHLENCFYFATYECNDSTN